MAFVQGNRTVLEYIPTPPRTLLNLTARRPGHYLLGHNKFTASPVTLVSIFHRQLGSSEDFLLAILSVVLIATLSDLAHSVLLRRGTLTPAHVRAAALLDDAAHLRALPSLLRRRGRRGRREILTSFVVLSIAVLLFVVEVLSVALTQPSDTPSTAHGYNLQAIQPISTSRGYSRYVRRLSEDRGCVTPIVLGGKTQRKYFISACHKYNHNEALMEHNQTSTNIAVTTYFHRGGGDHLLESGAASISVGIRAQVFLESDDGNARRLLFKNLDDSKHSHAAYIHERTAYATLEWMCNRNNTKYTCAEYANSLQLVDQVEVKKEIILWRGVSNDVLEKATGLKTTYSVLPVNSPSRAINGGIRPLVTSTAIVEIQGKASYIRVVDDVFEDGIPALVVEQGRVVGVVILAIVVAIMLTILVVLRILLRPKTLAEVAQDALCSSHVSMAFPEPGDGTKQHDSIRFWKECSTVSSRTVQSGNGHDSCTDEAWDVPDVPALA